MCVCSGYVSSLLFRLCWHFSPLSCLAHVCIILTVPTVQIHSHDVSPSRKAFAELQKWIVGENESMHAQCAIMVEFSSQLSEKLQRQGLLKIFSSAGIKKKE